MRLGAGQDAGEEVKEMALHLVRQSGADGGQRWQAEAMPHDETIIGDEDDAVRHVRRAL